MLHAPCSGSGGVGPQCCDVQRWETRLAREASRFPIRLGLRRAAAKESTGRIPARHIRANAPRVRRGRAGGPEVALVQSASAAQRRLGVAERRGAVLRSAAIATNADDSGTGRGQQDLRCRVAASARHATRSDPRLRPTAWLDVPQPARRSARARGRSTLFHTVYRENTLRPPRRRLTAARAWDTEPPARVMSAVAMPRGLTLHVRTLHANGRDPLRCRQKT